MPDEIDRVFLYHCSSGKYIQYLLERQHEDSCLAPGSWQPFLDLLLPPIDILWLRLHSSWKGVCPAVLLLLDIQTNNQ